MFILKSKFKEIIAKSIIETAKKCGRNLSIKEQNKILNDLMNKERKK